MFTDFSLNGRLSKDVLCKRGELRKKNRNFSKDTPHQLESFPVCRKFHGRKIEAGTRKNRGIGTSPGRVRDEAGTRPGRGWDEKKSSGTRSRLVRDSSRTRPGLVLGLRLLLVRDSSQTRPGVVPDSLWTRPRASTSPSGLVWDLARYACRKKKESLDRETERQRGERARRERDRRPTTTTNNDNKRRRQQTRTTNENDDDDENKPK